MWHRGLKDEKYHVGDPALCFKCGFPQRYDDESHLTEKEKEDLKREALGNV